MKDPVFSSSAAAAAAADTSELCAVVVIDASGNVVAANRSACALWAVTDKSLVGQPFPGLFAIELVSSDPEYLEAEWKGLCASALDRWAPLSTRRLGATGRDVRVRLERALGGAGSYIATIQSAAR